MHRLIIHQLGPIKHCELECSSFMTLTGFQASGKSTIAKAVYYFRTIKEDIIELAVRQTLNKNWIVGLEDSDYPETVKDLEDGLKRYLVKKYRNTFGLVKGREHGTYLEYYFTETCFVKFILSPDMEVPVPNECQIIFSDELSNFLQKKNDCFSITPLGVPEKEKKQMYAELYQLFDDSCIVVYIPAGRSMITLLSQQFNYIYATMDDSQRGSLDSCTRDYIERTLRLKGEFSDGLYGLTPVFPEKYDLPSESVRQAVNLIKAVLRGDYRCSKGEEQIILADGKYVKLNYASSGQQECVWILNLLYYYLLQQKQVLFIIEEPEAHLFPESQKYITELIALVNRCGHSIILTTHSPYVLGTLNNLLYACTIPKQYQKKASEIIHKSSWIDFHCFASWFVKNGTIENCMDEEIHMIQNEKIDEISKVINDDFERLLDLQITNEDGANV